MLIAWSKSTSKSEPRTSPPPSAQQRHLASGAKLSIGRDATNDIALEDSSASRFHARLVHNGQGLEIVDLDSSNGTLIDGKPVKRAQWLPGQVLTIGKHHFVILDQHAAAPPGQTRAHSPAAAPRPSQTTAYRNAQALQFRAFISYSHRDTKLVEVIHRRLEAFRIERDFQGRPSPIGPVPSMLRPIFRDRNEFAAGHTLTQQTIAALDNSNALIVICSPTAAGSPYVNEEVRLFRARHPDRPVVPIIVEGQRGGGALECFPPALRFDIDKAGAITSNPAPEMLAADWQKDGERLTISKTVARLLNVPMELVLQRHWNDEKRQMMQWWLVGTSVAALALIAGGLALLYIKSEADKQRMEDAQKEERHQQENKRKQDWDKMERILASQANPFDSDTNARKGQRVRQDQRIGGEDARTTEATPQKKNTEYNTSSSQRAQDATSSESGFDILKSKLKETTTTQLEVQAERGDSEAAFWLGLAYWEGSGGATKNKKLAFQWIRKAAESKNPFPRAFTSLGFFYCCLGEPDVVETDHKKAVGLFSKGAELGVPASIMNLARQYREGWGVERNLNKAEELYVTAGSKGLSESYNQAAWIYRDKSYGKYNIQKALSYHQRALESGFKNAATDVAYIHRFGLLGTKDTKKAEDVLLQAVRGDSKKCSTCWLDLASLYDDETSGLKNDTKATNAYLEAAKAGDPDAMLNIAYRYSSGNGLSAPDKTESFNWLTKARDAGNLEAIGALGKALAKGEGTEKNPGKAASLLEQVLALQKDPKTRFKIYVPNYWGYGLALAELNEAKAFSGADPAEAKRLYDRYGLKGAGMKRFTVPITCGDVKSSFHVYVVDWKRPEPSTDEQWEWLKEERGCTVPQDVVDSFRKLYKIANDNNVSFADLTVYALGDAAKDKDKAPAKDTGKK